MSSSPMLYHLPPTGTPISMREIYGSANRGAPQLAAQLQARLGSSHVWLLNSGRTAQSLLLTAMSALAGPEKTDVIIPAWTCYSIPAAIVRAGLNVRPVDIDPATLDYDYSLLQREDMSRTLAIVGCNHFGILTDWTRLEPFARQNNVFVMDDAAQSLGSSVNGKSSGSFGHAGILSFDRGKNLPAWSGGAAVTSHQPIIEAMKKLTGSLPEGQSSHSVKLKLTAYSLLLPPRRYWLPATLPFLGLGETEYEAQFEMSKLSAFQEGLATTLLGRLDSLNAARQLVGRKLIDALSGHTTLTIPGAERRPSPIYLRLPILAQSREHRDALVKKLRTNGLGAATMYPQIVPDIAALPKSRVTAGGNYCGAHEVANRLFTLPTHAFVRDTDIMRMAAIISTV